MLQAGSYVVAAYKTGTYIGRLIDLRPMKAAVEVLAVVQHPEQGNLHAPHEVEGVFFHQRKALAEREVALMPLANCVPYEEKEIPAYRASLILSFQQEMDRMNQLELQPELQKWAKRAIKELEQLRVDYGFEQD